MDGIFIHSIPSGAWLSVNAHQFYAATGSDSLQEMPVQSKAVRHKTGCGLTLLNVKAADDGRFTWRLHLGELHGVLGVLFFFELNGFGFLVHVDAFRV